ncbi:MAG: hypothetical protein VX325_03825 [Bacteroidota bacterium]|nr:hypothetical protein [Bacteroidota bacterium]
MIKEILKLLSILLFLGCVPKSQKNFKSFDYLPQNTFLVFKVNEISQIKSSNLLLNIFSIRKDYKERFYKITEPNNDPNALFFFTKIGKNKDAISLISRTKETDSIKLYDEKIIYSDIEIGIKKNNNQTKTYTSNLGGIKIISESQLVIEDCIRNYINNKKGITDKNFYELTQIMDNDSPVNIFVHPEAKKIIGSFFSYTPLFPKTGKEWIGLDMDFSSEIFSLNGIVFINDSIPNFLNLIKGQKPIGLNIPKVVPNNFSSYFGLTIENIQQLEESFKKYVIGSNLPIKTIDFSAISNIDEMGWIRQEENKAVVFHSNNMEINNLLKYSNGNGKKFRSNLYYSIDLPEEIENFLNLSGEISDLKWVMQIDSFFIFTENESLLKTIASNYKNGNTLSKSKNFESLMQSLSKNNSFTWIGNTSKLIPEWGNNDYQENILKKISSNKFPLIAMQGIIEKKFSHLHFKIQKNVPKQEKNTTVNQYNFNIENPALNSPKWLKNHRTKEMDIVIQDNLNTLYLFSNKGKLIWKKKLTGKIIGDVKQVDLYKNKRLQMAFRTKNRFMILDRNGKIVKPFNLKLKEYDSPKPLSIFDYDSNRNYRFLIINNSSFLMYDSKGEKVKGFKPKKFESDIINLPKHIRILGKDYLIFKLEDNTLRILNRKGQDRIKLKEKINFSKNEIFSYLDTFMTTNEEGNLIQIDTKGNVIVSKLDLGSNHYIDSTTKSLVTFAENILTIKGIPVKLPFGNYTKPKIFYINNTIYITITDLQAQKVYLFYSNGSPVGGFPVYGASEADLSNADKDKAIELTVLSDDKEILIYQIN